MNRYQKTNAATKIDGYYNPPREQARVGAEFDRARNECLGALRAQLEHVEQLTIQEFLAERSRGLGFSWNKPSQTHQGARLMEGEEEVPA